MELCETKVRERAYFIWEDEGRGFGRAEAHWLQAEAELRRTALEAPLEAPAAVEAASAKVTSAKVTSAKAAKPRASRAKAPAEMLAGVVQGAKSTAKAAAQSAAKPAAKAAKAAPKTAKPATSRAKPRAAAGEGAVLH